MQHLLRADRSRRPAARTSSRYADRMGFDAAIPFDLPTAVSQVTGGDGKQPGGFRDDVELANASYGQAETFVTPLQMALVAATVANGGELMRPRLVDVDVEQDAAGRGRSARSRWAGSSRRPTRRPSTRRWSRRSRVRSAASSRPGAKVPRRHDGRQVRHRRAGRHRRAALVVHRVRAGRGAEGRHRGHRRAGRPRRRGRGTDRRRPDDAVPEGRPVTRAGPTDPSRRPRPRSHRRAAP